MTEGEEVGDGNEGALFDLEFLFCTHTSCFHHLQFDACSTVISRVFLRGASLLSLYASFKKSLKESSRSQNIKLKVN